MPPSTAKPKLSTQLFVFLRFLTALCGVWLFGYHGLSIAWVCIITVFLYIYFFEGNSFSFRHPISSLQHLESVNREQTEWLSKVFYRLWPYQKEKVDLFMRNQLQHSIRKNLPSTLQSFTFTAIDLGDQVPQVLAVNVKDSEKDYIILDIEILYNSNADIGLTIGKLESSIQDVQVHGTLRVVLTELNSAWPFFGKMNISFVSAPSLSFRLAKAASILNIAGFRDIIHESISDQLTSLLVLPHCLTIAVNNNYSSSTSYPLPQGVLRIHVNRAKDLPRNDQTDSIDPYCVIQVGATVRKTGVIQKTDLPMWNESFEFLVNDVENQYVEVQCVDAADTGIGSLGSCYVSISTLTESSGKNIWLNLDKSSGGTISITPTWLQLSDNMSQLPQPEMIGCQWKATAMLTVGVQSARNLPASHPTQKGLRSLSKPSSYVRLSVDTNREYYTKLVPGSMSPSWGENFSILSSNPAKQKLMCEVIDDITDSVLGSVEIPLSKLIDDKDHSENSSYKLEKCSSADADLALQLSLKALVTTDPSPVKPVRPSDLSAAAASQSTSPTSDPFSSSILPTLSLTQQSFPTTSAVPSVSTPIKPRKITPLSTRVENDNSSSGGQSDLLDFDNWSETESNVIAGGSTYIVISRPDGSTVSEIVQKADESATGIKENLNLDDSKFGKIQITLRYSTTQQKLMMVIHQCRDLVAIKSEKDSVPDPFVMLTLYNGRHKVDRKRTKSQKATLNPVYDETFEFKLLKPNVENAMVELSIKNKRGILKKGKSTMGSVLLRIPALDLSEARTDWFLVRNIKESSESIPDMTQSFTSQMSSQ